jgi:uncharacterized protein involved in outer membrane biogenesis
MKMKWFKRLLVLFAVLVATLAVLPLFVSLDDYRPRIERLLSEKLKEPVTIKRVRLAGLPLPHVIVDGVEIGKADIRVGRIAVTPDLLSMLSATKVIRGIDIDGLVLNQRALDRIPAWTRADPKAKPADFTVQVRAIVLDDALLQLQKATFGPFDARISLAANGFPERANITARDGKFKAKVIPSGGKFGIEVDARGWRPPTGPPILFDELQIRGVATTTAATLSEVRAKLYGGTLSGTTTLGWQKGMQLKGGYQVSGIELRDLVPLFSPKTRISGRLTAKPVFSGSAPSAGQLQNLLKLETPFDIRDGVLQGVDIRKAASSLLTKDSSGETRFDTLSGHYALDRGTQRITGLKVASGSLAADGNVTIAPNKSLSGRINAQLGTGKLASATVPLNVSGTLDSPMVLPTGASVAGAALGTAVLGPGVGTSVGAKIGNWAEGLFGGDKKK